MRSCNSIYKSKLKTLACRLLAFLTAMTLGNFTCSAALADEPKVDWFSIKLPTIAPTKPIDPKLPNLPNLRKDVTLPPLKGSPSKADAAAAQKWFKQFDHIVEQYRPTSADRVILSRPVMQEEERVQQWTSTARKISKNYLQLTKSLKEMPLPAQLSDVREYRDLTIDWYQDAARIFDELIRPRTAAKTIEELQRQLDQVKSSSAALASSMTNIGAMDQDLRKRYSVDIPERPNDEQIKQALEHSK